MKAGSKKCHSCGKMAENPYKYTIVPSRKYGTIPTYNKAEAKMRPNREDLKGDKKVTINYYCCLLYTSPSPRDRTRSRMPSSA